MDLRASKNQPLQAITDAQGALNKTLAALRLRQKQALPSRAAHLAAMSDADLNEACGSIQLLNSCLQNSNETDLRDTKFMLNFTLGHLRLQASEKFVNTIEIDDLVEGYSMSLKQIFRNFQYMEICGYDLLDLLTYEWPVLYERSQTITTEVLKRSQEVMATGRTVSLLDLPAHYMKERLSESRQVSEVRYRYLGPLFDGPGNPAGVIVSSKARIIDEYPDRHELRFI